MSISVAQAAILNTALSKLGLALNPIQSASESAAEDRLNIARKKKKRNLGYGGSVSGRKPKCHKSKNSSAAHETRSNEPPVRESSKTQNESLKASNS